MGFLDSMINSNSGLENMDLSSFKDIVTNLNISLAILNYQKIEYINPAGELLLSRINGCSKENFDADLCINQIKILIEQGLNAFNLLDRQNYSYITAINGLRGIFYLKIDIYRYKDDINRLMVLFEDYTDTYLAEEYIKTINKTNNVISKITQKFLNTDDRKKAIYETLREIGLLTKADRVYILEKNKEVTLIDITHEWFKNDETPLDENRKKIDINNYKNLIDKIEENEKIKIIYQDDIPDEMLIEKEYLSINNINSMLFFPLKMSDETLGFLGADNISETLDINNELNKIVRLACRLITNHKK